MIRTVSPSFTEASSLWAMYFFDCFSTFEYMGCRTVRSTRTTTDFCILLLTTMPWRTLRMPRSVASAAGAATCLLACFAAIAHLGQNGFRPGDVAPQDRNRVRGGHLAHHLLAARPEELFFPGGHLGGLLVGLQGAHLGCVHDC